MTLTVTLPWPAKGLWPNRRPSHWAAAAKVRKAARLEAGWLMIEQGIRPQEWPETVPVRVIAHPPSHRRWDEDNLTAACKGYFDAVAERIGLDDGRWRMAGVVRGEVRKPGAVIVEFG